MSLSPGKARPSSPGIACPWDKTFTFLACNKWALAGLPHIIHFFKRFDGSVWETRHLRDKVHFFNVDPSFFPPLDVMPFQRGVKREKAGRGNVNRRPGGMRRGEECTL